MATKLFQLMTTTPSKPRPRFLRDNQLGRKISLRLALPKVNQGFHQRLGGKSLPLPYNEFARECLMA
jgi:hypothetical protein